MASTTYSFRQHHSSFWASIRWDRAIQAGLITGAILFLLTRGIPWIGSGAINPAVVGREISPGQAAAPGFFFSILMLHFIVSALYGLIIAPIVHGFRPLVAGAVGAVVGLVLYFISYALAGMMMETMPNQSEASVVAIHVIFGIVCAECYKGFVRRRAQAPLM